MATITDTCNCPQHPFPKTFILATAFTICFALVIQLNLHSLMRHKEADAIHQACKQNPIGYWEADDGKSFLLCQLPDGSFGIQVMVEKLNGVKGEVTAFIRKVHGNPVMDINKVIEYIEVACKGLPAPMP